MNNLHVKIGDIISCSKQAPPARWPKVRAKKTFLPCYVVNLLPGSSNPEICDFEEQTFYIRYFHDETEHQLTTSDYGIWWDFIP